jgi:hypothetical protein
MLTLRGSASNNLALRQRSPERVEQQQAGEGDAPQTRLPVRQKRFATGFRCSPTRPVLRSPSVSQKRDNQGRAHCSRCAVRSNLQYQTGFQHSLDFTGFPTLPLRHSPIHSRPSRSAARSSYRAVTERTDGATRSTSGRREVCSRVNSTLSDATSNESGPRSRRVRSRRTYSFFTA